MDSDFKTHFIMVMVFLVILSIGVFTGTYCGYKVGVARGDAQGYARSIRENPKQMITGTNARIETIYNNSKGRFRISFIPFCTGWGCE